MILLKNILLNRISQFFIGTFLGIFSGMILMASISYINTLNNLLN